MEVGTRRLRQSSSWKALATIREVSWKLSSKRTHTQVKIRMPSNWKLDDDSSAEARVEFLLPQVTNCLFHDFILLAFFPFSYRSQLYKFSIVSSFLIFCPEFLVRFVCSCWKSVEAQYYQKYRQKWDKSLFSPDDNMNDHGIQCTIVSFFKCLFKQKDDWIETV